MKEISTDEVAKLVGTSDEIEIIDVREAFEVELGTIPGAKNIPLGEISQRVQEFSKDKSYIIICRSGNRSGVASYFLHAQGIKAYNMVGGLLDWSGELEVKKERKQLHKDR